LKFVTNSKTALELLSKNMLVYNHEGRLMDTFNWFMYSINSFVPSTPSSTLIVIWWSNLTKEFLTLLYKKNLVFINIRQNPFLPLKTGMQNKNKIFF
jgi:hypothetical protein